MLGTSYIWPVLSLLSVFLFPFAIGAMGMWSHHKEEQRLNHYRLEQERIQREAEQAVIDCEELWTQWDWERQRGLR